MKIRKTIFIKEIITTDEMGHCCDPVTRVAAMAVFKTPFAGTDQEDLSNLFEAAVTPGDTIDLPIGHKDAPWSLCRTATIDDDFT